MSTNRHDDTKPAPENDVTITESKGSTSASEPRDSQIHSKDDVKLESGAEPKPPALTFPEGGSRAWLTVAGGSMVTFCTFGVIQSYGVYQDHYSHSTLSEHTPSEISWIGSVQVFFVFAIGLPAGRLFDAGYFHHCLIIGSLLYTFSAFMLSLVQSHHYYQNFLAQGVGMGIGMGLMFLPSLALTSHYFRVRRSLAMGMVIAGSSLGGCLYPILLNNVFDTSAGFAWGVRAVAFLDMGLLFIANLIMRTRLPAKRKQAGGSSLWKTVLTDVPYLVFVLGVFLIFWGVFVPFFYLQLYARVHDVPPTFTIYAISIMNAASLFGRTVPNLLADFYGPVNVMIISATLSGGLIFALFGATSIGGVTAFGICYGFFSGGVISLATPAASCFATQNDLSDLGIRIGILSFSLAFALLTGNPIAGALLSPPENLWHRPLIFAAVVVFAGACLHVLILRALVIRKGTRRV